jgi:type IV pilus assembly protein PilY1
MDYFRMQLLARALTLLVLALLLVLLPMEAGGIGSPPLLDIASEPLGAGCVPTGTGGSGGSSGPGGSLGPTVRGTPAIASDALGAIFQPSFDMSNWAGHLERYAVTTGSAAGQAPATGAASWDAGAILTGSATEAPRPLPAERKLYTAIVDADGSLQNVLFEWASLSDAQRALLNRLPTARRPDGLGELRLEYLRGDRRYEGNPFRRRTSLLGDTVHSNPVYVGAPTEQPFLAAHDGSYNAFYQQHQTRRKIVYLGANDGMLHAFDAQNGAELFAYVPDALMASLSSLTSPTYVHRSYVDGPAMAAEAWTGDRWRTTLVAAFGGGAQGLFALDVTDPDHFADSGALWEFTDRDDPLMGNIVTPPQIARFQTRAAEFRYFVVVASGLNNNADDGHHTTTGRNALFLLALDKPRDAPWQLNVNYFRITTPISDPALANGLSAPALAADSEGNVRYAYAGDMQGNLWRFDFQDYAPWTARAVLFVARDASGRRQPIAQQPTIVYAQGGGYLILFGTGRLIERADLSAAGDAPQSFYAILDRLEQPPDTVRSRSELTQLVLHGARDAASLSLSDGDISPGSKGWYVDFLDAAATGERSLNSGMLLGGVLYVNTLLPGADSCSPAKARSYAFNVATGSAAPIDRLTASGDYVNAPYVGVLQPMYAALPFAFAMPDADSVSGHYRVQSYSLANFAAVDAAPLRVAGRVQVKTRFGRLSWREVANWRELHAASR